MRYVGRFLDDYDAQSVMGRWTYKFGVAPVAAPPTSNNISALEVELRRQGKPHQIARELRSSDHRRRPGGPLEDSGLCVTRLYEGSLSTPSSKWSSRTCARYEMPEPVPDMSSLT